MPSEDTSELPISDSETHGNSPSIETLEAFPKLMEEVS